jgi:hypothetical protein
MQTESTVESNDAEMLRAVERAIRARTWGRVANLLVEARGERVIVRGSAPTYYLKQLALEAAREALATTRPFLIDIDVT